MRFLIANPTASLYNNRTQMLAALEFACLDILGQKWGVPVCDILGGQAARPRAVRVVSVLSLPKSGDGSGEVRTVDQLVAQAQALKQKYGFTSHKLKGGVFAPEYELECYRALAEALPGRPLPLRSERRLVDRAGDLVRAADRGPEQRLSRGSRVRSERHASHAGEGAHAARDEHRRRELRAARGERVATRPSTSFCSTRRSGAAFAQCVKAAGVCETFQLGVAVHSSGELGIQLATMLHLGAVIPNLTFAADAHYHHLIDDVIDGGKMQYCHGAIAVPTAPGLGVKLDRDKLAEYHELFKRLGAYPYDQDPLRPGWTPIDSE